MKKSFVHGLMAVSMLLITPPALAETPAEKAAAAEERKRLGSLYLRCDGKPNNMTDAESFARVLGAITLLGLFAPTPEAPDASKRLFGDKGVDACSQLLDDPKQETNGLRRLPLILARAAHRIEAKDYQGAIGDVDKARGEAQTLGLTDNPYFMRSMGLSFDRLEAEARLRLGDATGAQAASLRQIGAMDYSLMPLALADNYAHFVRELTPKEEAQHAALSRILVGSISGYAARLEEAGRFKDAALQREAQIEQLTSLASEQKGSIPYALAAVAHALAGDWETAATRAGFARSNLEERQAAGKPEDNTAAVVEVLDLYEVLKLAKDGKIKDARRNFAARSAWLSPGFGTVLEVTRRLREGAAPDELFGGLSKTPDQLWAERRDRSLARRLEHDTDNRTLFQLILPYAQIGDYEAQSKQVWRADKSKLISASSFKNSQLSTVSIYGSPLVRSDAILLHTALVAKERGKQGFTAMILPSSTGFGLVRFVDKGETGVPDSLFIPADAVIAELSQLIPSPATIAARKKK